MKAIAGIIAMAVAINVGWRTPAGEKGAEARKTDKEIVVQGNNEFALALYAKLRSAEGNLFFSPYSISAALAMTYVGARGSTESQMSEVLHFPAAASETGESAALPLSDRRRFACVFGEVIKDLNNRGQESRYKMAVANALWAQKDYGILAEYLELIKTGFDGKLQEVDFVSASETARKTINSWVEEKTNEKIKDLLAKGILDSMTRLVLTNAVYFKGDWARQFKAERTKDAPFTLADGNKIDVPMMNQVEQFGYMETDTLQALELPYVDDELSMIVLLPKKLDGIDELEQNLTVESLSQTLEKLHKREVVVSIPKFKMTWQFGMADVLRSMGMQDAFSGRADFSGINGQKNLFISAVIHKAYVDINEEGTEAAAATAVTIRLTSVGPVPSPVFRADHPFLFLIRDNNSGSILFIGRVMNPKA